ncbi:MAG TPA: hypothetical protein VKN18_28475 [Blastocatellia bacterium]|nr:hypothetical protein [Blastocatellia bacterium]
MTKGRQQGPTKRIDAGTLVLNLMEYFRNQETDYKKSERKMSSDECIAEFIQSYESARSALEEFGIGKGPEGSLAVLEDAPNANNAVTPEWRLEFAIRMANFLMLQQVLDKVGSFIQATPRADNDAVYAVVCGEFDEAFFNACGSVAINSAVDPAIQLLFATLATVKVSTKIKAFFRRDREWKQQGVTERFRRLINCVYAAWHYRLTESHELQLSNNTTPGADSSTGRRSFVAIVSEGIDQDELLGDHHSEYERRYAKRAGGSIPATDQLQLHEADRLAQDFFVNESLRRSDLRSTRLSAESLRLKTHLSAQEDAVIRLSLANADTSEIAKELDIREEHVRKVKSNAIKKLKGRIKEPRRITCR